jgi:hypothetical protein
MKNTALQRLFWRTPTELATPLEDFLSEVVSIAVEHDPRPFVHALEEASWRGKAGKPEALASVLEARSETQVRLEQATVGEGGRLDIVVTLLGSSGETTTVWVEAKVDAGLTYNWSKADGASLDQLEVYLKHLEPLPGPRPFLVTLTKEGPLRDDVTGITWRDIVRAVRATSDPQADRWWLDLAAFLEAEVIVGKELPERPIDPESLLPVFRRVNKTIEALWGRLPRNLHYVGIDRYVRSAWSTTNEIVLTSGPLLWGLRQADRGWEWWVAVGDGTDYTRVRVEAGEILAAARRGGLPLEWSRLHLHRDDRTLLLEKGRAYVPVEQADDAVRWLEDAMRELRDAGVLDPYHARLREKDELRRRAKEAAPRREAAAEDR